MGLLEKLQTEEKQREQGKFATQFWKPKPGDVLIGTVTKMGETITSFGERQYMDVQAEDGNTYTVFLTPVLKRLIEEKHVKEGSKIAIKFTGIKTSSKNRKKTYKDFILVTE